MISTTEKIVLDERQMAALHWAIQVAYALVESGAAATEHGWALGEMLAVADRVERVTVRLR